ncbi:MAG: glycoside hydrolase family 130 protein [Bacteroidota bacterium]
MEKSTPKKTLIKRSGNKIDRNNSRVITRPHIPSDMLRVGKIIDRVANLTEKKVEELLKDIIENFYGRHKNIKQQLHNHFEKVKEYIPKNISISEARKELIGAYFTMEYSIESAALFNPSIVKHPNQEGLQNGEMRFIMSLRATGEGHISCIVFRSGVLKKDGSAIFDTTSEFVGTPDVLLDPTYDNHLFRRKLKDMKSWDKTSSRIFENLPDNFTNGKLKARINDLYQDNDFAHNDQTIKNINWLANSNYTIKFDEHSKISERVIFPVSENESRGIEDARFVEFHEENGESMYYATYTAYNNECILPHLLETKDFIHFNIITLNGKAVQNKGMALFPRKINGKYVMLSRLDGENNHIMFSEHLHFWNESRIIQKPIMPWEFVQIGNCGSPLETSEGWLVLTHGVGAMRQYSIGAVLLDLENPERIIARLEEPLIIPNEKEREGYVPNVVYSCGSLIHNNILVLPYAMSDISSNIATVKVEKLIARMKAGT